MSVESFAQMALRQHFSSQKKPSDSKQLASYKKVLVKLWEYFVRPKSNEQSHELGIFNDVAELPATPSRSKITEPMPQIQRRRP